MATMKTLNGYGFNATEFDGKTSDSYTAADSAKLGGKAPEYYIQPRNLLDNSDWEMPSQIVNQRGYVSGNVLTAWKYFIDRWMEYTGGTETTFTFDTSGGLVNGDVAQKIENNKIISGNTYTYAVYYMDGSVICASGVVTTGLNEWTGFATEGDGDIRIFLFSDNTEYIGVLYRDVGSKRIKAHALYEGSYTADTLPPYVPKGYAAELMECRRYAKRIKSALSGIAHGYESGKAYATIFTSGPKMRISPSVDDYSKILIINGEQYSVNFTPITGIATIATREDSITCWVESSEISAGKDYYISCDEGVLFSADL